MKYWLILLIFDHDGEFSRKIEIPTQTKVQCYNEAAYRSMQFVNKGYLIESWCVTDDHHAGRKQDPGIPYD